MAALNIRISAIEKKQRCVVVVVVVFALWAYDMKIVILQL